jgi:cobalt/nickel transport protein
MRLGLGAFIVAGLGVALALAFFVSPQASGEPDGLNKVAIDKGFAETEEAHALDDTPTAGYEVRGVDDDRLSTGLAGIIGVAITFTVAGGLLLVVRHRSSRERRVAGPPRAASSSAGG